MSAHELCQCGCGQPTNVWTNCRGQRAGVARYIKGHQNHGFPGRNWRGGRRTHSGYVQVWAPEHPRAGSNGYVYEHILVVERTMGKPLRADAEVHHVNEIRSDNRPGNLVACDNLNYHALLHRRMRALRACGHADWNCCTYCKLWGPPDEVRRSSKFSYHRSCGNAVRRRYRAQAEGLS